MSQVISISPNGEVSGLQVKPGKGFDLRQLGKAQIKRASEIVWDEEGQMWYVQLLSGPCAGAALTHRMWIVLLNPHTLTALGGSMGQTPDHPIEFQDYDQAVAAEIRYLDTVRLKHGPSALD